jgi:hypothetical protein
MRKLSDRWFKEDREQYKGEELKKQKEESDKALRNSSLLTRRLKRMLEEDLEATSRVEEDFDDPAWERKTIAAASERKTLRRIMELLP